MKKTLEKTLKKSLGQNFLHNTFLAYDITEHLISTKESIILEIGCGNGALTKYIKDKEYKEFHIVEYDEKWAKFITEEYIKKNSLIIMHNQDILMHEIKKNEKYNIIGNIPYNITYSIIQKIFNWYNSIDIAIIMMQEEVAQKIAKTSGSSYGPISVISQLLFDIKLHQKVAPFEFVPEPRVFSRVIELKKKVTTILDFALLEEFKKFLSILFSHPRKKIKHQGLPEALKLLFPQDILNQRSQELSPEIIYNLFLQIIKKNH
jgi:16S rRNA (adenine1518-N6/adenine1519-N6)-dimethyltransferase